MSSVAQPEKLTGTIKISLGPLIPLFLSAYISTIVVVMFFFLPLQYWKQAPDAPIALYIGVVILGFLFLPRRGILIVDPVQRTITFRESLVSAMFHFWRGRDTRSVQLAPGTKIVFGTWMESAGDVDQGIKYKRPGQAESVFVRELPISPGRARTLHQVLLLIQDIDVRPAAIDDYKDVPWDLSKTEGAGFLPTILASWILPTGGFFAAMLGVGNDVLVTVGIASTLIYLTLLVYEFKLTTRNNDAVVFDGFAVGFSALRFALFFAVLTLVGTAMR